MKQLLEPGGCRARGAVRPDNEGAREVFLPREDQLARLTTIRRSERALPGSMAAVAHTAVAVAAQAIVT
jgi:hypothetical protein